MRVLYPGHAVACPAFSLAKANSCARAIPRRVTALGHEGLSQVIHPEAYVDEMAVSAGTIPMCKK